MIRALRTLAETGERAAVRRAARAVLRYATGATLAEAVADTPYGIGWVRGLIEAVKADGVDALRTRKYRAPRSSPRSPRSGRDGGEEAAGTGREGSGWTRSEAA